MAKRYKIVIAILIILVILYIMKTRVKATFKSDMKVAYITAIYGKYEITCKPFVNQNIKSDFICFTNNPDIAQNGWIIDTTPYHEVNKSKIDDDSYVNSITNNKHTFNIGKYYKQNFHNIPRLHEYDIVIWMDGSLEIIKDTVSEIICDKMTNVSSIVTWEHEMRGGSLKQELDESIIADKYYDVNWIGQKQPFQDVKAQYEAYLQDGYDDESYWKKIDTNRKNLGVWVTCFVAFDMRNKDIIKFLDLWYLQTLKYTTQDQVGFSYVVQKLSVLPITLPDSNVSGSSPHDRTDFYIKHGHGK